MLISALGEEAAAVVWILKVIYKKNQMFKEENAETKESQMY